MVPAMILVIFNFIHSYFKTVEEDEKRKLKWIFIGLLTGPFVYTFFYSMPRLDGNPLISEELMLMILLIAPITFLIAIFRYRIIDINFIVSKGMVYSLIVLIFSLIYVILIAIVANTIEPIFTNFKIIGVDLIYVLISIFAIFIFQPVKNIVQHYIDRKFYRVKYNYKVILSNFLNKIRDIHNESQIVELIVSSINRAIPISSYLILWRNGQIQILYSDDFDYNNQTFDKIDSFIRSSGCRPIYSNSISVEEDLKFTELDKELSNEGIELILNSFSGSDKPKLTFIFGKKKAENKFSLEDVELLNTILDSSSVAINRIKLQTELILKQNEAEKLKEINEVKSYFVSSVSHELKTPLTAIKLYAEFLNSNPNLTDEKKKNYLAIIEGECNRLDRLINNVLGFSKIEKGTKKYRFDFVDLKKIIDYIIETFQYQLNMQNFQVDFYADKYEDFTIYADEDALKEVFINLISNSIKYSISEKLIVIRLSVESDYCIFSISDKGVGINSEEISKIFTPFFRSNEKNISSLGGAGLGLAIVKNILDAHSAEISVESEVGKGTSFKIKFQRKT
jgi:signal transduction histidine kinase